MTVETLPQLLGEAAPEVSTGGDVAVGRRTERPVECLRISRVGSGETGGDSVQVVDHAAAPAAARSGEGAARAEDRNEEENDGGQSRAGGHGSTVATGCYDAPSPRRERAPIV